MVLIASLAAFSGCTADRPDSDILGYTIVDGGAASSNDDTTAETVEPNSISGCAWASGSWELTDCVGNTIGLELVAGDGCSLQIVTNNSVFVGALGSVQDAAIEFKLLNQHQCHGVFDGTAIMGVCGTGAGPCEFVAVLKN